MKKGKIVSLVVAGTLTATALLAGTYAWTAISQQARNENQAKLNPGARLHDDYDGIQGIKRVYVENYNDAVKDGDSPILVRVRLDEYMEIGSAAGRTDENVGTKDVDIYPASPQGDIEDVTTWETYVPDVTKNADGSWSWKSPIDSKFREHMDLTFGATEDVYYMPTFNKDHDSLDVDVNGTYIGTDGKYDEGTPFDDYEEWSEGKAVTDYEIYDGDDDAEDNDGHITSDETITHTAALIEKEKSVVISMDQWADEGSNKLGNFWIYDTEDGWAYWANPLYPGEVTGLLLSENSLGLTPLDNWYYAMNVVGQFVTADSVGGKEEPTGFYTNGVAPSDNAIILLNMLTSVTQKSMQTEVVSGQEVSIVFEENGTETAGTVAIVAEEVAATGEAKIADEAILTLVKNENGVVTVKGHKPGVGTVLYTAADGVTTSVARVTVDYATHKITTNNYTVGENNEYLTWSEENTALEIEGYYTDTENDIWYQVVVGGSSFKGNTTLKALTLKNGVTFTGTDHFRNCTNLSQVSLPDSVTELPINVFWNCPALESIELPDTLTALNTNAFRETGLKMIEIPSSVKTIGTQAFASCSNLETVIFYEGLATIGASVFTGCTSLTEIKIPDTVKTIGDGAFNSCTSLERFTFGLGVESVGEYCIYDNKLSSIHIPESVKTLEDAAIGRQPNLTEITVAEGNEYFCVGYGGALYSKDLSRIVVYPAGRTETEFEVPEEVDTLSKSIFMDAFNLENIIIPEGVKVLPQSTFNSCKKLTTVTIPSSVERIDAYAFRLCDSLSTINFTGSKAQWETLLAGADSTNDATLHREDLTVECNDGDFVYGQAEGETDI